MALKSSATICCISSHANPWLGVSISKLSMDLLIEISIFQGVYYFGMKSSLGRDFKGRKGEGEGRREGEKERKEGGREEEMGK